MPGKKVSLALSILVLMSAANTVADDGDRAAILALMDTAFHAVGSDDPDDMRAIQLAERRGAAHIQAGFIDRLRAASSNRRPSPSGSRRA